MADLVGIPKELGITIPACKFATSWMYQYRYRGEASSIGVRPVAEYLMISIVDDDKSVREAANMLIKSLGYATATFASAEEFLESGRLRNTACLITDVQMPGMSGVDLQSYLLAKGHRTPLIFVTAHPEGRLRERALASGALGFLSKPFREEDLIACLDSAARTHNSGSH